MDSEAPAASAELKTMTTTSRKRLPGTKRVFFAAVALTCGLLLVEGGLRVYFSSQVGASVMLYGTPWHRKAVSDKGMWEGNAPATNRDHTANDTQGKQDVRVYQASMTREEWSQNRSVIEHTNKLAGYSKYYPNQDRVDFDVETGEQFSVGINSAGFRGPDFDRSKQPGVIRVITLGASSTFGYFDRDNETYPQYLHSLLNDNSVGQEYEVINLAIPHQTSAQIRELFFAEALVLEPDVVTFYEGNNDTSAICSLTQSKLRAILSRAGQYSVLVGLVDSVAGEQINSVIKTKEFEQRAAEISSQFVANVGAIEAECRSRRIRFIAVTQQNNSQTVNRSDLANVTYADEVKRVQQRMRDSRPMRSRELAFLTHSRLMADLRTWATGRRVPLVDGISILDRQRDEMLSWVHLSPTANRLLAKELSNAILTQHAKPNIEL